MPIKNRIKITFKEFLKKKGIKIYQIQSVSTRTVNNILKSEHSWKYNKNYRWKLPYFPTERTISLLCLELDITYHDLEQLIQNQYKSNKKLVKNND